MQLQNNIKVKESASILAGFNAGIDPVRIQGRWKIEIFKDRRLIDLQEFPNLNANIGIGDSATAAAVGQTDLQAASNKLRKVMDATFPSRSGQVMTFKSTFATSDANYAWNEIALFNAASTGTMFSRAVIASPFTKTSALSITATYSLTCP
jgi:hypothetical protein